MARSRIGKLTLLLGTALFLAGCQDGAKPFGFLHRDKAATASAKPGAETPATAETSVKLVDRDVEAPEVFHVTEKGLWDGRPSLGGVWVAYPTVNDPERVIIRNPANGKFVIGALFRRERNNPGPKLQLSSDAAETLGLLAGQPATISVVALRRQAAPVPQPDAKKPILDANEAIQTKPIDQVAASASAAIDKAAGKPVAGKPAATKPAAAATMAPATLTAKASAGAAAKPAAPAAAAPVTAAPPGATGERTYLQIGIFSVEANATKTAAGIKKSGLNATVTKEESQGKAFWRVIAGPIAAAADRDATLAKMKKLGYADAYFVSK